MTVGVDRQHAVLGMYPFPSARRGYDLLWEGIHARLPETPALLDWSADPHSSWREPGLVLGQACGWPLMTELRGVVRVVGTFAPSVPYARDHRYRSVLLTRRRAARVPEASEFAGRTAAANISRSLSGWVSLLHAVHGPGSTWQGPVVWTGAHADSVRAVFEGRADVMSIDSVTLALLRREIPEVIDELVEIGLGPEVPALPLIARGSTSDEELAALRRAIVEAFEQRPEIGESIMAERFVPLDETAYECVLGLGPSGDGTRAG